MERSNKFQNILIICLLVAVVAMSVGFATYTTVLNITGTATFSAAKWDIHFENYTAGTGSQTNTGTGLNATSDTLTFAVALDPGEFYDFTIDAVNDGTFDAKLQSVTISPSLAPTYGSGYYTFTCTYGGSTTSCSDAVGASLAKDGGSASIHVHIGYELLPQSAVSQYPTTASGTPVSYSIQFNYVDADAYVAPSGS